MTCTCTGKILTALLAGLTDRSIAVRKSYARTIGHIVKVGITQECIKKKIFFNKKKYSIIILMLICTCTCNAVCTCIWL